MNKQIGSIRVRALYKMARFKENQLLDRLILSTPMGGGGRARGGGHYSKGTVSVAFGPSHLLLEIRRLSIEVIWQ